MCDNRIWCDIFKRHFFFISMSRFPINTSIYILLRHTNCDTNETNTDLFQSNLRIFVLLKKLFISILGDFCYAAAKTTSNIIFKISFFFLPPTVNHVDWRCFIILFRCHPCVSTSAVDV